MKYIEGFRDGDASRFITGRLKEAGDALAATGRRARVMEVCGSHTMSIARYGIRDLLPECVDLISGPGCPVCVTDAGYIDAAIRLGEKGVVLATFGDMLRVPGSSESLAEARSRGVRVEVCYSPNDAVTLAQREPGSEVVFLAIGFETTVAPVISIIRRAEAEGVDNISLLAAFKLVPPALEALLADPEVEVNAFICPAHVSAIIGARAYQPFVDDRGVPCVIAGFEPLDILYGVLEVVEQLSRGEARLVNQYARVVKEGGNPVATALMDKYLRVDDVAWRGIGVIPDSGLVIREEHARWDARVRHGVEIEPGAPDPGCLCGDVLKGKISPADCPMFGEACTPLSPVGPCMVSSEGSCAAYFKYVR